MAIEFITIKDAADVDRQVLADLISGSYGQVFKVAFGADGSLTLVDASNGLPAAVVAALPAGDNNIGNVDIASALPAGTNEIGIVDLDSVPAASRTTDSHSAVLATDAIMNNLTVLTPKFAKANVTASSTDASIVAAVASKKLRVLSFRLHTAGTATTVTFNSKPAGAGTAISEAFACGANGGRSEPGQPWGHFETASGEGLTVTTGAGSTTGVGVTYIEV